MIGLSRQLRGRFALLGSRLVCYRHASTLVIAEHDNVTLSPSSLCAVTAAGELKGDITMLILGHNISDVAQQVGDCAVQKAFNFIYQSSTRSATEHHKN